MAKKFHNILILGRSQINTYISVTLVKASESILLRPANIGSVRTGNTLKVSKNATGTGCFSYLQPDNLRCVFTGVKYISGNSSTFFSLLRVTKILVGV